MSFLTTINGVRKSVMRRMTRNIGTSHFEHVIDLTSTVEIKRILISRPNHRLGNLLLITPLIQEVSETLPECKIDLFVKGSVAPILFKNYTNVDRIIQLPKKPLKDLMKYVGGWMRIKRNRYDIVINVVNNSSSGRLSTKFANSKYKFFGEINEEIQLKYTDHEHIAKYPVYSFRNFLNKLGFPKNEKQVAPLNLKLSPDELAEGKKSLQDIVKNDKKTIALFTYATGAKRYSESWWEEFYERVKSDFQDYNVIEVLPVENVSQIAFKAPSFYSKDVRQIGSLIANTDVFIGADSGMMHLASASLAATVALFKVTSTNTYRPYGNKSTAIDTNTGNLDDWMNVIRGILTKD